MSQYLSWHDGVEKILKTIVFLSIWYYSVILFNKIRSTSSLHQNIVLNQADDLFSIDNEANYSDDESIPRSTSGMDFIEQITKELSFEKPPSLNVYLDIDHTLVNASPFLTKFDFKIFPDGERFCVQKRPHLDEFMKFLNTNCVIYIFTSAEKTYADEIIDKLKIRPMIKKCYYRGSCQNEPNYEKSLKSIHADLNRSVLIDDSILAISGQYKNSIIIKPYNGGQNDNEFARIQGILEQIMNEKDVRSFIFSLWHNM